MLNFLLQGKVGEMMAPVQSLEAQLLIAIQNRQNDKIRELLEVKGVGANNANDRGVRPMHMACLSGNSHLVQRLLELGADILTADKSGNTPLHYASKGGHAEMVKMLVGQGAVVEQRNGSKLTAYDVATDHVIRQFLLPLQLKAEAGNPDYAVQTMGITSDAPRNYEQYGVPGMSGGTSSTQAYGHQQGGGGGGASSMDAALGALMQAPTMGPPRPGGRGMPPPAAYRGAGGFSGAPAQQPDMHIPPGNGVGVGGYGTPGHPPVAATPPGAALAPPRPAAAVFSPTTSSSQAPASPPPAFPGVTMAATAGTMATSSPSVALQPPAAGGGNGDAAAPLPLPGGGSSGPTSAGSPPAGDGDDAAVAVGPKLFTGVAVHLGPSPAPLSPKARAVADTAGLSASEDEPLRPGESTGAAAATRPSAGKDPLMSTVDLSSTFQTKAAVSSGGAAEGSLVGGSGDGAGASGPPPPPGVPSRPPAAAEQKGGSKFKPIKADGFHSSASDKELQARYGHTKIVKEFGAPPTAAQLGAGALQMGGGYMAGSLPGPPPNAYAQQTQTRSPYAMSQNQQAGGGQAFYSQPFGGGDAGSGDMHQHNFGHHQQHQQHQPAYHAPPQPPRPPVASVPAASAGGVSAPLPMPGGYQHSSGPSAPPPPRQPPPHQPSYPPTADSVSGGGGGDGGYSGPFNPTTTVVAASSTSSAVL